MMNLVDVKRTVTAARLRTLRFVGLLAIGIAVGALTAEMFPEPVAAAAHPCEMEYCDHHFPLWWWQSDVCRYSDSNTDCTFISRDECVTQSCYGGGGGGDDPQN